MSKPVATISGITPDQFAAYLEAARAQGMTVTANGGTGELTITEREITMPYVYDPLSKRVQFFQGSKKNFLLRWSWVGAEIAKQARAKGLEATS